MAIRQRPCVLLRRAGGPATCCGPWPARPAPRLPPRADEERRAAEQEEIRLMEEAEKVKAEEKERKKVGRSGADPGRDPMSMACSLEPTS
jgi:hypothetical protein